MKTKISLIALGIAVSPLAFAGISPIPSTPVTTTTTTTTVIPAAASKTENRGYAGLKWTIPGPLAPSLVLGVRRAKVESDGDTSGGDLSFAISLANGIKPEKLRLKGFMGKDKVQGEIGGGFDFGAGNFFAGPSLNVPYANLGVDWLAGAGLNPYLMIHSMGKYDKPAGSTSLTTTTTTPGTPTCPDGFELDPVNNLLCNPLNLPAAQ